MFRYTAFFVCCLFSFVGLSQTSLEFDGINDYVNCGNDPSLNLAGTTITLEAWVYPTSFTANVWQGNIINKNGTGDNGYMLRAGNGGQVNFNIGNNGWHEINTPIGTISLNTWHHLAATYDGIEMRIYVDGNLSASGAQTIPIGSASNDLLLAEDPQWVGRFFPGRIDEVRVWNVARSQAEIQATMSDEMCTTDPNLLAYYRFNNGVAGANNAGQLTLTDESGNGIDGTLINFANAGGTSNWATGIGLGAGMTSSTTTVDACETYTWVANGQTYTTSGIYSVSLTGAMGCDSTSFLDLSVYSPNDLTSNVTTCDSYYWSVTDSTYSVSTTDAVFLVTNQGCVYTHTLNLTLNHGYDTVYYVDVCDPYVWPVNGQTYFINGFYTEAFTTAGGCDSLIHLSVYNPGGVVATVQQNGDGSLSTNNFYAIQWVDCDNNYAPIVGETSEVFFPTVNGNYAVIASDDLAWCPDTSECFLVDNVVLNELEMFQVIPFPNPTSGTVHVDHASNISTVSVMNMDGTFVAVNWQLEGDRITISLPEASGVYLVEFTDSDGRKSRTSIVRQ